MDAMSQPEAPQMAFCTTREASEILGVSLRTVQLWAEAGLLEAWKTSGGHRRILRNSVDRLLSTVPLADKATPHMDSALRILLVDDDPAVLRVWEQKMARWPMKPQVITAQNGVEALVRAGLKKPDLLVTDLQMPGMDGFQMLRQLTKIPELADVTIIVVTGLDPEEIETRGGIPESIPVLHKPMPFDQLRDIATVVALRKQREYLQTGT